MTSLSATGGARHGWIPSAAAAGAGGYAVTPANGRGAPATEAHHHKNSSSGGDGACSRPDTQTGRPGDAAPGRQPFLSLHPPTW